MASGHAMARERFSAEYIADISLLPGEIDTKAPPADIKAGSGNCETLSLNMVEAVEHS